MIFDSESEKRECYKKNCGNNWRNVSLEFESRVRDIKQKLKNANNW